jgi:hypothetical protein
VTDPKPCNMQDMGGVEKTRTDNTHGCGADAPVGTLGKAFNNEGGGVWATRIEADGIKAWHFLRGNIPSDCLSAQPDPTNWTSLVLHLGAGRCDMSTAFQRMKIVLHPSVNFNDPFPFPTNI